MLVWAATFLRGTSVVICADNFFCHEHKGVLIPQPLPGDRQDLYLASHPSFEKVELLDDEAVKLGFAIPEPEVVEPNGDFTESDLNGLSLDELKDLAKAMDINPGNSGRQRLTERILEAQNGE